VNPATHVNGTIDFIGLTCTTCHGDPQRGATTLNPQLAAAPPLDTVGNSVTTSPGVGAHQAHLNDGSLRGALACTECHAVPTSIVTHPTGTLNLTWGTLATTGGAVPTYAGGTCSTTYCHGATLNAGGTNQAPRWTGGSGEVACGTCHGAPPPSPHPVVTGGLSACNGCHSATVDATGAIIPASAGGKHIDGIIQATGGHDASWMDQASPGFHAYSANQGLGTCQGCHGTNLDGAGGVPACAQCHNAALPVGVTSWKTNCVMCHGGTDNQTGAPPKATWGNGDPIAVGAHTSHVTATHGLSLPVDCASCHVKPADALAAGHVDGAVTVTGYTGTDPGLLATVKGPSFSAATATCATSYCHGGGGTLTDGTLTQPRWTQVDGTQGACGTCHGIPPASVWGHAYHRDCQRCHLDVATWDPATNRATITNPALHVNGVIELLDGLKQGWIDWTRLPPDCSACHYY
jgi:predicted CxxxxCH...CXXCH cytochrome family protein